jgi:DsbC/DsbD-like thiol-disulfide interchange protein
MSRLPALLALVLATLFGGTEAPRAETAAVSFLPGWRQPDGSRMAALEIRLQPGWHTYWRAPGANGIPPQFDWSGSSNLRAVRIEWPKPIVFDTYGARTIGYRERLVLPILLDPDTPDAPIDLQLGLFFGICKDICIPANARVEYRIAPDTATAGRESIEAALATRAHSAAEAGVTGATCTIRPEGEAHAVTATVHFANAPPHTQIAVLEAPDPNLWISEPVAQTNGTTVTAAARIEHYGKGGLMLDRSSLRLTLLDETRAIDIRGCPAP